MRNKYHRHFFIGPMTKNTVTAVVEYNRRHDDFFGFIPSRRQIECDVLGGGYVNNWSTREFKIETQGALVLRDHAGPMQGKKPDDGIVSLCGDIDAGINFIHIDPWKDVSSIDEAIEKTISLIKFCDKRSNSNCYYEVGTEAAIFPYTPSDLERFVQSVRSGLGPLFDKIIYCVVQSGTQILGTSNVGVFDLVRSSEMCRIVKDFGLLSKEHNSDYLTNEEILARRAAGVDSLNIAPELGVLETDTVLQLLSDRKNLFDDFVDLCHASGKWKKWVRDDVSREESARICGHYMFASHEFEKIKMTRNLQDFDFIIREKITDRLLKLNKTVL